VENLGDSVARAKLAGRVYAVPMLDHLALELSRTALQQEDLGVDAAPDLLCLSLSNCDGVGHRFGPRSVEVTDVLLRVDRGLGVLFDLLDRRLGRDGWVACLSADHGIPDLPEQRLADGFSGLRVSKAELAKLRGKLRDYLKETLGSTSELTVIGHSVWMDAEAVREAGGDPDQVRKQLAELVRELAPWADLVFTREELIAGGARGILGLAQASYQDSTAPDLLIHSLPGTLLGLETGTSHGSAHDYDRSVPLIFLGSPFAPGEIIRDAGSEDAVPTLLRALGWTPKEVSALDLDGQSLLD
jgi:arylsulfatase A-like enzyme